jgi:myo-inositol-1(or 4)-monophosphatase
VVGRVVRPGRLPELAASSAVARLRDPMAATSLRPMEASAGPASADTGEVLHVLVQAAEAVGISLAGMDRQARRRPGGRPGQYLLDLVADEAVCGILHRAGLSVLSEESGRTGPAGSDVLVVVDPVDGSTNASLGLPWFAVSLCALDPQGPLVALVVNLASGSRYEAARGAGALCDGEPIRPSGSAALRSAVVGVSGLPAGYPGWAQFRALGAASLDICAVAEGSLDGYRVAGASTLSGWDYLGALLVASESGAVAGELDGRDLVVRDDARRRPVVAATPELLEALSKAAI